MAASSRPAPCPTPRPALRKCREMWRGVGCCDCVLGLCTAERVVASRAAREARVRRRGVDGTEWWADGRVACVRAASAARTEEERNERGRARRRWCSARGISRGAGAGGVCSRACVKRAAARPRARACVCLVRCKAAYNTSNRAERLSFVVFAVRRATQDALVSCVSLLAARLVRACDAAAAVLLQAAAAPAASLLLQRKARRAVRPSAYVLTSDDACSCHHASAAARAATSASASRRSAAVTPGASCAPVHSSRRAPLSRTAGSSMSRTNSWLR
jgi:hypothetical protein